MNNEPENSRPAEQGDQNHILKKSSSTQLLDQLKATVECDRHIHELIAFYSELHQRMELIEEKMLALQLKSKF